VTRSITPARSRIARWVVGIVLIGHGLIHGMGPVEIWGVADLDQLTGEPSFNVGAAATDLLAVAWLIALLVLIAAGGAVLARRDWWRTLAIVGVVVSQSVIVVWWDDAATGTIPNLLVITAVVVADRLGLSSRHAAEAG